MVVELVGGPLDGAMYEANSPSADILAIEQPPLRVYASEEDAVRPEDMSLREHLYKRDDPERAVYDSTTLRFVGV